MGSELRQLAVVSGKGGTGKTTVLGSFAALAGRSVLADCDVDAADLHLLLHPYVKESHDFYGAKVAVRDHAACRGAGECERLCRFDAITTKSINVYGCEGCGVCVAACPNHALRLETIKSGEYYISECEWGPMVHARLLPGGESSGRLVTVVRQAAESIALADGSPTILIDGPPGIGCTATAAIVDVSLAFIVTEPTLSGRHDLERVVELAGMLRLPCAVAVNKADINAENTAAIGAFCEERGIAVVAQIPFDDAVPEAIGAGVPLVQYDEGPAAQAVRRTWEAVSQLMA
jgi:MinD superfamily P-loop ATPase